MLIAVITITQLTQFVNNSIVNKLLKIGFNKLIRVAPTLLDEEKNIFYNKNLKIYLEKAKMNKVTVYKAGSYSDEELFEVVAKHFEFHGISNEINADAKVLIKPNLVADKDPAFAVATNPRFVFAIIRYLNSIGIKNITVADCPGGALLLYSSMIDVYKKTGYSFLEEYAELNTDFESGDVACDHRFTNKSFNIINAIKNADYVINVPKFKTHNMTCMTAAVKNLFGCIPGLQKPAFHAKYPAIKDFSNMLVELAATVKPDFTIVDAIDIMEGNGPTNGKKRHLGVTFASKDVFVLDKIIAQKLGVPEEKVATLSAAESKGLVPKQINVIGDTDFRPDRPILLSELSSAKTAGGKVTARIKTLIEKAEACVFMSYPKMNEKCILCGKCVLTCPKSALKIENKKITLDKSKCIGCLCCDEMCPNGAVDIGKALKRRLP